MSPKIEYPKPLPQFTNQNSPLESGFIPTEIVALQNGWRLTKRCLYHHSVKISTDFFSENYSLLERFRNMQTNKFNLKSLHQHIHQIMDIYGRLIESGLHDVTFINMLLSNVGNKHKLYGVQYDEIELLTNYIREYLMTFLDKIKSTTFVNGLEKLNKLINEHHKEKLK